MVSKGVQGQEVMPDTKGFECNHKLKLELKPTLTYEV